jgi:predicted adenylyl cyclase CyaB
LIAYDRPDAAGPKESVYTRVRCGDAAEVAHALETVLPVRGQVRKHREVFNIGRTRVHLDQVEQLGSFVELEVVLDDHEAAEAGRREAEFLMKALSISPSTLVSGAYIDLLERSAGG